MENKNYNGVIGAIIGSIPGIVLGLRLGYGYTCGFVIIFWIVGALLLPSVGRGFALINSKNLKNTSRSSEMIAGGIGGFIIGFVVGYLGIPSAC